MDINDLFDVIEYGFKYYINDKTNQKISWLEYFSLVDVNPKELAKIASAHGFNSLAVCLRGCNFKSYWHLREIDVEERLSSRHSINGYELTQDDKLTIIEKLKEEDLPLLNGIYDVAVRQFVIEGIDALSKDYVRDNIIDSYNRFKHCELSYSDGLLKEKNVLVKKI